MPMRRWERGNDAGIEQRRSGRAVGNTKALSRRPGPVGHPVLDHAVCRREAVLGVGNAPAIAFARGPKPVRDDLLHGKLDVEIEEAIPEASIKVLSFIFREKSQRAAIMPIEIFNDYRGLRNDPVRRLIVKDRYLSDRPQAEKASAGVLVTEIDDVRHKGRRVFVERDQNLMTKRSEWVIVKRKRHQILRPCSSFQGNDNQSIMPFGEFR